ncbi:membrane protein UL56 [Gallid alphaherpesvirus 3]|uniref:membrane protein UL56 n=1 Tax=Gallid alphaherpesvirus 3 TaxID=35250 RepID=UPI000156D0EF|nr:membrane protein UL56 [Gallid alphaherpesvirus 3]
MDSDRPQTELTSAELDRGLTSEAQALHEEQPFLDAPGESVYEHFELQLGDGQCDAAYLPPYEASNGPPPTYDSPPPPYETSSSETNDEEDWLFNARQDRGCDHYINSSICDCFFRRAYLSAHNSVVVKM